MRFSNCGNLGLKMGPISNTNTIYFVNMGGQHSSQKNKKKTEKTKNWNPISELLDEHTIEALKNKWDNDQLELLEERIRKYRKTGIPPASFFRIYPNLTEFSHETKGRIFKLFHRSHSQTMTNEEFLIGITLVKKSENPVLIGKMVFFLYSSDRNMELMEQPGFMRFLAENKSRLREQDQYGKIKQWGSGQKTIQPNKFLQQFERFDFQKFVELFQQDYVIHERLMVDRIKTRGFGSRQVGDEVYLVEFKWYLQWKKYIYMKYGIDPRIKDRTSKINKEAVIEKSILKFMSNEKEQYLYHSKMHSHNKRPGVIPNFNLVGDEYHELCEGMKEFEDYILVPAWLWETLNRVYYGHPTIKRLYPQIYCIKVYQVFVDEEAKFIPNKTEHLQLRYNEMKIDELFHAEHMEGNVLMHKYPSKQNWEKIPNMSDRLRDWATNCKMFLCFVPKKLENAFIKNYNVFPGPNGNKVCQNRITNYGNMINILIHGIMQRAFVIKIAEQFVWVEYRNQENSKYEIRISIQKLIRYNPSEYNDREVRNPLAGLTNHHGGYSYMNAVIQCLIRTPHFGHYLQKLKLNVEKGDEQNIEKKLILWALSNIFIKSKDINIVRMDTFRRAVQKKIPKAKKGDFIDAFDFLDKLLVILSEEVKQYREEYKKGKSQKSSVAENPANIKVDEFFLAESTSTTCCLKCNNKREKETKIYTHSIELPEFNEIDVYFYYFPYVKEANWMPVKFGLLSTKQTHKDKFMEDASKLMRIPINRLKFYAMKDGEWVYDLVDDNNHQNIFEYVELGFKILVYEITDINAIHLQVKFRREKKNHKSFRPYAAPLLVEIKKGDPWGYVMKNVVDSIQGKYIQLDQVKRKRNKPPEDPTKDTSDRKSVDERSKSQTRPRRRSIMVSRFNPSYVPLESHQMDQSHMERSHYEVDHSQLDHSQMDHSQMDHSYMEHSYDPSHEPSHFQKSEAEDEHYNPQFRKSFANDEMVIKRFEQNDPNAPKVPYEIRLVASRKEQVCFFCRRHFKGHHYKHFIEFNQCKGCMFDDKILPMNEQKFIRHANEMVLVVDWDHEDMFSGFEHIEDRSFRECEANKKKADINFILNSNPEFRRNISDVCQKCSHPEATIEHKIKEYPNILILHLERFKERKHGLVKLNNLVEYPDFLFHDGEKYELFGVVAHYGQIYNGGYYNYVKIDNLRQWFICKDSKVKEIRKKEYLDPGAYILFYKKSGMDPALMFLNPLVV